jgi:hypothetical protein
MADSALKRDSNPLWIRVVKGVILLIWIVVLFIGAVAASKNYISQLVFEKINLNRYRFSLLYGRSAHVTPYGELERFLKSYDGTPPPIESVADSLVKDPSWISEERIHVPANEDPERWKREQYQTLFQRIAQNLQAIAYDKNIDPHTLKLSFAQLIPDSLIASDADKDMSVRAPLPAEAINWVLQERKRIKSRAEARKLVDTFGLLMVIGAFGSLIFLTRDYIVSRKRVSMAAYIFRPILGMFLAVSMFILDMAAQTLISEAEIYQIRHETLYLLALAAGLLTEKAYFILNLKATDAIDTLREKKGAHPSSKSDNR